MNAPNLRPSPIAGTWYPGHPTSLRAELDRYLSGVQVPPSNGQILALIVPHAGYVYSGAVAAHAFAWLRGLHPEIVAVVSPLHTPHPAMVLTSAHTGYVTPLGAVEIDRKRVTRVGAYLSSCLGQEIFPLVQDAEHSLEIELPFLQHLLDKFRLIPLMLRDQSWRTAHAVGDALALVLREQNALLVASSDLSHFYPQKIAAQLDAQILQRVQALDPEGVIRANEDGLGFACGRGAVAAVLWAARQLGANTVQVVCQATSGDVTGDFERVVGYGAAVVLRSNGQVT